MDVVFVEPVVELVVVLPPPPHGLGRGSLFSVPCWAFSPVVFPPTSPANGLSLLPAAADIIGSWMSRYMRCRALNPPGRLCANSIKNFYQFEERKSRQ